MLEADSAPVMPWITWGSSAEAEESSWFFGGFVRQDDGRVQRLREQAPAIFFHVVSGVEFLVDGPMNKVPDLQGRTLDCEDGQLRLT